MCGDLHGVGVQRGPHLGVQPIRRRQFHHLRSRHTTENDTTGHDSSQGYTRHTQCQSMVTLAVARRCAMHWTSGSVGAPFGAAAGRCSRARASAPHCRACLPGFAPEHHPEELQSCTCACKQDCTVASKSGTFRRALFTSTCRGSSTKRSANMEPSLHGIGSAMSPLQQAQQFALSQQHALFC